MDVAELETPFDKEQTLEELEATFQLPPETSEPAPAPIDPEKLQMQLYGINTQAIAQLKAKCLELECNTPKGYDDTRRMIGLLRTTRTRIEKRRKEHNAEHQEAIRFVNGIAKQLTTFVENLEDPLKQLKLEVDEAKERAKRAAEQAEQERLAAIEREKLAAAEAERKAAHEAEQARLKAEAEKLAKERAEQEAKFAAERAAMEAERAKLAAERAAAVKAQQEAQAKLDAERRAVEEARAAQERAEAERLAKIKAEQEAAAQAERDRIAAEEAKVREAERQAELERRRAALAPDMEKIKAFAGTITRVANQAPQVVSEEAQRAVYDAQEALAEVAASLENWRVA